VTVLEQILTGTFADGLGNVKTDPTASTSIRSRGSRSRLDHDADEALGQIKGDVDYAGVAKQVSSRPTPPS
jgi:nitrate/nitrite transport system substrate-binding protein